MIKMNCFRFLHRVRNEQGGLTLVEVLISMLLLSIGLLTCMTLLATGVKVNDINRDRAHALNLAEQKLESLKQQDDLSGLFGEGRQSTEDAAGKTYMIKETAGNIDRPGFVEIRVTVSWKDKKADNKSREVSLATLRPQ